MTCRCRALPRGCLLLALLCGAHVGAPRAAEPARLQLSINGLKPALEEAVRSGLTLQQYRDQAVSEAQLRRLATRGEEEIRATLEAWGYYDARVSHVIGPVATGGFAVDYDVDTGEPVRVSESTVAVSGEAARIPAVASAIEAFVPRPGERFDHAQYEASKSAIEKSLADSGFLGAKLRAHRVEIQAATRSARIELTWDGGPRYQFGKVHVSGAQFATQWLEQFMPWREGDDYSSEQLLDLQQRLVGADYFSTVIVQPHLERAVGLAVPVDVELTPAKRNIYSAALYASTDRGAGLDLSVQRRWLNERGHKGQAEFDLAQRLKAVELSYRIPMPGRRQRMLSIAGTYRDEETESSISQTEKLAVNLARKWGEYTSVYGLQLLAGDFEIGSEDGNSSLLFFEGALSRASSDQPAFARRGFSYNLSARFTPVESLTDTRFASLDVEAKWLRALGTDMRLILRGEVGAMKADDFDLLPPELRFFSGGDRSIRGFGYEEIGSRNAAGDVIGGDRLVEGTVELERYWRRGFGAAVFADVGDAFLGDDFVLHAGAGVGVRWKSPVGVLRLDLAYPLESVDSSGWQIHFNIGPDF
jgi:translocation and assembly module TamA